MSDVAMVAAPQTIVLASPASGVVDQIQGVNLSWKSSDLAASYHLQVTPDSSFQSGYVINDASLSDTVKSVTGLTGQQKYYWRVRGVNVAGNGSFSESRTFTTGFPSTPVLALPTYLNASVPLNGLLAWKKTSSAISYRAQLSIAADFSSFLIDTSGLVDTTISYASLATSTIHFWKVSATNLIGVSNWSEVWRFRTQAADVVGRISGIPETFALGQNYPNPFNPGTVISFSLAQDGYTTLKVYDLLGREVATLVSGHEMPGGHTVEFNGANLASGLYLYRLVSGSFAETKRMILQK
jgi:hypothetical protein